MRTHDEQRSHASTPTGARQLSIFAISSAKSFLPTPASPANISAPGTRPVVSIRRKISLTRWFPARLVNITKCRIQKTGVRSQKKRETESVEEGYRLLILDSGFWILNSAFRETVSLSPTHARAFHQSSRRR